MDTRESDRQSWDDFPNRGRRVPLRPLPLNFFIITESRNLTHKKIDYIKNF